MYNNNGKNVNAFLTEDSVVLITGAAGFLGSELALALHRTYSPKRIICVDRMGDRPERQEELALFEFQRQRSFNILQTLGDKGQFYRVDFSPMIPEYYDLGEVPVLDHIFRENIDISHVVHLADPFPHSALQAVPREKEVPKAGMMEALLEQLAKHEREGSTDDHEYVPPNFVYASSYEVYPHHNNRNDKNDNEGKTDESIKHPMHLLLEEKQTLSTPSSLRGASKMMDEMIAKLYYDTKGIYSVGLRFFSVYGPWGVPGSPLFEMAERAVAGNLDGLDDHQETSNFHSGLNGIGIADKNNNDGYEDSDNEKSSNHSWKKSIHDFVYIDDAVDAIMAAMQFRSAPSLPQSKEASGSSGQPSNPHPIIFNVASGEGHSLEDVLKVMQEFFPPEGKKESSSSSSTVTSELVGAIGSTKRAESLLGYQPQVSLREGIIKMLAWHYDRTFPYGGLEPKGDHEGKDSGVNNSEGEKIDVVTQQGMAGCLHFDKECLRGTPVFPCASECSHKAQCTKSYYDEVIGLTQKLTSTCETVLYTVDLDDYLTSLPSAKPKFQTSKSFLKGTCNLAFVSQQSLLIQNKQGESPFMSGSRSGHNGGLYRDGSWVLIPLKGVPSTTAAAAADGDNNSNGVDNNEILKLLPKLSPGLFFGSKTTKRAIYIDPNIVIDNISKILTESYAQPYSGKMEGATAMLIGRGTPKDYFANDEDEEEIILKLQDPNYQHQNLESTNTLVQNAAYRMVKIAVSDNLFGDGFMELLDSRWIVHGLQSDDGRLFRCDVLGEIMQWKVTSDRSALEFILGLHDMWSRVIAKVSGVGPWWIGDNVITVPEGQQSRPVGRRRLQEEDEVAVVDTSDRNTREKTEGTPPVEEETDEPKDNTVDDEQSEENSAVDDDESEENSAVDDDESEENSEAPNPEDTSVEGEERERGEFVADAIAQKEVIADGEKRGDSSDEVGEENRPVDDNNNQESDEQESHHQRDFSSFDTWMGILSSSRIKYFVRIVPSSEVGIVSIDNS
jgi:nucleoside-diphosphate-sugar epimerase